MPHAQTDLFGAGPSYPEGFRYADDVIDRRMESTVFDAIVGVSLAAPCTFRMRRRRNDGWERVSLTAAARSAYLLSGPARSEWEHSIPAVAATRYSVTFRSLREG